MMFTAAHRIKPRTDRITRTGDGRYRRPSPAVLVALLLGTAWAFVLLGCDESDVLPPAGATLSLTADPASVVTTPGAQVVLRARVTNSLGVSLPGQTVRFSTSEGVLTPSAETPVETDASGVAISFLTWQFDPRTTTVEATSGGATDSTTVNVLPAILQDIILNSPDTTVNACNDTLSFTAQAWDTSSVVVPNLRLNFELRARGGTGISPLGGTFNPAQGLTDSNGELNTELTFDQNTCNDICSVSSPNHDPILCSPTVVAFDLSGLFESTPLDITFGVP